MEQHPNLTEKPAMKVPSWSLRTPPQAARFEEGAKEPSVLILIHPSMGTDHLTKVVPEARNARASSEESARADWESTIMSRLLFT